MGFPLKSNYYKSHFNLFESLKALFNTLCEEAMKCWTGRGTKASKSEKVRLGPFHLW